MRRWIVGTLGTLLFVGLLFAVPPAPTAKPALRCTLTNQKMEKCCCQVREGKLYCPLAKKVIDACCCVPADAQHR